MTEDKTEDKTILFIFFYSGVLVFGAAIDPALLR